MSRFAFLRAEKSKGQRTDSTCVEAFNSAILCGGGKIDQQIEVVLRYRGRGPRNPPMLSSRCFLRVSKKSRRIAHNEMMFDRRARILVAERRAADPNAPLPSLPDARARGMLQRYDSVKLLRSRLVKDVRNLPLSYLLTSLHQ